MGQIISVINQFIANCSQLYRFIFQGPRYADNEIFVVNSDDESWSCKLVLPYTHRFPNGTEITERLPEKRYAHTMGCGTTVRVTSDSEGQIQQNVAQKIVMFGGERQSE